MTLKILTLHPWQKILKLRHLLPQSPTEKKLRLWLYNLLLIPPKDQTFTLLTAQVSLKKLEVDSFISSAMSAKNKNRENYSKKDLCTHLKINAVNHFAIHERSTRCFKNVLRVETICFA